jgi:NAD(P)-dependent dehydrogenase (short-subunit alcohol dehydrogenase family)
MRLAGKVAIITGAATGIGRATALLFAREGAKVTVMTDKNIVKGEETVALIRQAGGEALFVQGDVAVAADCQRVVRTTVETFGRLDILVNNAAWSRAVPAVDLSEEDWDRTIAVTLKGPFLMAKYAIPEMIRAGGGSIINISSVNGFFANPAFPAYAAAKGGLNNLTRQLALDYGRFNIRVNAICPGIIANERTQAFFAEHPEEEEQARRCAPLGRYGWPEDVARAALFFASDESSFATGSIFVLDGGLSIQSVEPFVRTSFARRRP